jgi:signal peptidase I
MGEPMQDGYGNSIDPLIYRSRLMADHLYHKGDDVVKLEISAGDHLFVDRLTYNFFRPARGDTIVFETAGIPSDMRDRYRIPDDQFYIKRLVGLPGEKVQIGDDRHLIINGRRLDATTPHFEDIYSFNPSQPPHDSQWSGHVNGTVAQQNNITSLLYGGGITFFPDQQTTVAVPPGECLPMGDNTCNSLDSRFWGPIPESYVIGRSFFVYWPLTSRFGLGNH